MLCQTACSNVPGSADGLTAHKRLNAASRTSSYAALARILHDLLQTRRIFAAFDVAKRAFDLIVVHDALPSALDREPTGPQTAP